MEVKQEKDKVIVKFNHIDLERAILPVIQEYIKKNSIISLDRLKKTGTSFQYLDDKKYPIVVHYEVKKDENSPSS